MISTKKPSPNEGNAKSTFNLHSVGARSNNNRGINRNHDDRVTERPKNGERLTKIGDTHPRRSPGQRPMAGKAAFVSDSGLQKSVGHDNRTATPETKRGPQSWQSPMNRGPRKATATVIPRPDVSWQKKNVTAVQPFGQTVIAATCPQKRARRIDWSIPAIMIYFSLVMGVVIVLLHGLDILVGWPFHQASIMYDVVFLACGAILAGMSWHTYQERVRFL